MRGLCQTIFHIVIQRRNEMTTRDRKSPRRVQDDECDVKWISRLMPRNDETHKILSCYVNEPQSIGSRILGLPGRRSLHRLAVLQNYRLLSEAGEKILYKKSVFLAIHYICKHFIDFICRGFSLFRWEVIYYSLIKNPLHIYVLGNFYDVISFYKFSKKKFN